MKFKVGDKVRCKVHGTEFIIRSIQSPAISSYVEELCYRGTSCTDYPCGKTHDVNGAEYFGVPEKDLELVECKKSELTAEQIKVLERVVDGSCMAEKCSDCPLLYDRRDPARPNQCFYFQDRYADAHITRAKQLLAEHKGEVTTICDDSEYQVVPVKFNYDGTFTALEDSKLNSKEENMFSICEYIDEIATGITGLKVIAKKKIKNQLENNQDRINQRINSEFWEDGTMPNKERVLEINKEIEREKKEK
jgi:hypothetical protein